MTGVLRTGTTMLWLELTLTSGARRYLPIRPIHPDDIDTAARTAIQVLLDDGTQPVRAIADDQEGDGPCGQVADDYWTGE